MGLSGISPAQLLVILAIVLVVFGTKRVKSLGSDLGGAIKGFRRAMESDDEGKGAHDGARQLRIESERAAPPDADDAKQISPKVERQCPQSERQS